MHAYKHKEKCIYFIPPPCPLIMNMHVYYNLKAFTFALDYNIHVYVSKLALIHPPPPSENFPF